MLQELIDSIAVPGWRITLQDNLVRVAKMELPEDSRRPGELVTFDYADHFHVYPAWSEQYVIERIFATVQYLTDHELREQFMVGDVRYFEPHPGTGRQKDWWVERMSAVRGY